MVGITCQSYRRFVSTIIFKYINLIYKSPYKELLSRANIHCRHLQFYLNIKRFPSCHTRMVEYRRVLTPDIFTVIQYYIAGHNPHRMLSVFRSTERAWDVPWWASIHHSPASATFINLDSISVMLRKFITTHILNHLQGLNDFRSNNNFIFVVNKENKTKMCKVDRNWELNLHVVVFTDVCITSIR